MNNGKKRSNTHKTHREEKVIIQEKEISLLQAYSNVDDLYYVGYISSEGNYNKIMHLK